METATKTAWWQQIATGVRMQLFVQRRTITDLATAMGRGRPYVSRRVNGKEPFGLDEIEDVAKWLGVSVKSLSGEEDA